MHGAKGLSGECQSARHSTSHHGLISWPPRRAECLTAVIDPSTSLLIREIEPNLPSQKHHNGHFVTLSVGRQVKFSDVKIGGKEMRPKEHLGSQRTEIEKLPAWELEVDLMADKCRRGINDCCK